MTLLVRPNKVQILITILTLLSIRNYGQQGSFLRHQVGLNASEFVVLFENQPRSTVLNYRLKLDSNYTLRAGVNYDQIKDADNGYLRYTARLGADRVLKQTGKWEFYAAIDGLLILNKFQSDDRYTREMGFWVSLGILFKISKHFSISTEPNFSWFFVNHEDPDSFSDKISRWQERRLSNIGQLLLNVHF